MNTLFDQIIRDIVKEQERIVGPLAWSEARKVKGLTIVNESSGDVKLEDGKEKQAVDDLVGRYERIFGKTSQQVCKHAVIRLLASMPADAIPSSLI